MGRVWPRHSHRGSPLNSVVRRHEEPVEKEAFGICCSDLREAMTQVPSSFFRVEANGVLYLTVGYVETENGRGYFDQAVLFCPFCGSGLQTREMVKHARDA